MAFLEIEGILNGRRLRRCSPTAHWRYGYYLLLTNGYGRIEMDFESISYRLVSFRGTAPTPQDIESEFCEYAKNHLIFVYEHNGRKWAQFDTSNAGAKDWKTSVDLKSPMPPDEPYCEWLKEQHGDQWKKFHWYNPAHKTKGIKQVPAWASPSLAKDLTKSQSSHDQGSALGLGSGLGLGIGKKKELKPSARKARGAEVNNSQVAKAAGETRHSRLQQIVMGWYLDWAGVECPWDGGEGRNLKRMLDSTPNWPDQQFISCLENVAVSECIPKGERPREWLEKLPKFLHGPLDRFWKPIGGNGNGNGTRSVSKADAREKRIIENVLAYRTATSGATHDPRNGAMAVPGDGETGVCGLDGEPEIIPPGKDPGRTEPANERTTKT